MAGGGTKLPRSRPEAWRLFGVEQVTGTRGRGGAPAAKRGRTTSTLGWRLLRHPSVSGRWRGSSSELGVTRRGGLARPTANLVFAGRGRACLQSTGRCPRLGTLRLSREPSQRPNGELSCHGGASARHGVSRSAAAETDGPPGTDI